MKVRITKCSELGWWYREKVGEVYFVEEERTKQGDWQLVNSMKTIRYGDCEIIEEPKETPVKQFHNVQNPQHYHHSGLDPISYAEVNFPKEQLKGFHRINVLKYISRYEEKGGVNDLVKARTYLDKLIELERENK